MQGLPVALLSCMLLTALAGCGDAPPKTPAEIVFESKPPQEINSNDTAPTYAPSPKTKGHLAGVVVDQAIRPLKDATIHLPGLDLTETSERDGSFGFVDLYPGPYFITVALDGYYAAEAVVEVHADQFTRVKVILEAIPPPDPYHVTQQFDGFAELGGDPFIGSFYCRCTFDFYLEQEGLQAVIIEATMSAYSGPPGGTNGFYHDFGPYDCCAYYTRGSLPNPLRVEARDVDDASQARYSLRMAPEGFPAPETNKQFTTYVTAFYNELPPVGWSFLNGDT